MHVLTLNLFVRGNEGEDVDEKQLDLNFFLGTHLIKVIEDICSAYGCRKATKKVYKYMKSLFLESYNIFIYFY